MIFIKSSIFLLWLGAVLDPVGQMFGIRYLSIALSVASIIWLIGTCKINYTEKSHRSSLILFIAGILPIHGLFIYSLHAGASEFIDTSYIAAGLLIIFSLLYRDQDSCMYGVKALLLTVRFLSILIIVAYASPILGHEAWISFFTERSVALVSFREYSGFNLPYVYFLASPLLILLIAHDFSKFRQTLNFRTCAIFALSSFSLFLTGTRAHIIISIFFIPIYMLLISSAKTIYKALLFVGVFFFMGLALEDFWVLFGLFFSPSETSNSMKLSLLDGYMEIFSNPVYFIAGQGFNAHEWSSDVRQMVSMEVGASKTELTYLELIRVFGVFVAAAFISTLLFFARATKSLPRDFSWIYPGLVIYLANAAIIPNIFAHLAFTFIA